MIRCFVLLLFAALLLPPAVQGQAPRGRVDPAPTTAALIAELDRELGGNPDAWRDGAGNLPAPLLLKLGMNPTDAAAARAYVLFIERKTLRTALAQALVTVEQHRRNLELLEGGDPLRIEGALKVARLAAPVSAQQAALQQSNLIADEQQRLADAERRYGALLAAFRLTKT